MTSPRFFGKVPRLLLQPAFAQMAADQTQQSRAIFKISWNCRWCWFKWWNIGCRFQRPLVKSLQIPDFFNWAFENLKKLLLTRGEWRVFKIQAAVLRNTNWGSSLNVKCCRTAIRENIRHEIVMKISLSSMSVLSYLPRSVKHVEHHHSQLINNQWISVTAKLYALKLGRMDVVL